MNYVDSAVIVAQLKNRMSGYFSSRKVDDSIFPRVIQKCLSQMGLKINPVLSATVDIKDSKGNLPSNFYKLLEASLCGGEVVYLPDMRKGTTTAEKLVCELDVCQTACDVCRNECGNMFRIVQLFEFEPIAFTSFSLMHPATPDFCDTKCKAGRSGCPEFTIRKRGSRYELLTNFDCGLVYIRYYGNLETATGYMIPENGTIQDWIFEEMRYEAYQTLYDNGEDVVQRLAQSKAELAIKQHNAREVYRLSEVSDYYNMAQGMADSYKKVSQPATYNKRRTAW